MKSKKLFVGMLLILSFASGYSQQIGSGYPSSTITNFNTKLLSGFYQGLDATGQVQSGWAHLLNLRHSATTNTYQLQISSPYGMDDKLYFRKFAYNDLGTYNPAWIEIATRGANTFTGNQIINGSGSFQGITSSLANNEGGSISLLNPSKTADGIANKWQIYNMTGAYGNSLQFYAYDNKGCVSGGLCAPRMTLLDSGNVGIGTTTPNAKLHINNGDNSYGAILANANEGPFSLYSKSLTTEPYKESFRLGLKYNNDESNGFISFFRGGSTNGGFLGFSTNGLERLKIDSSGNVGIGITTPTQKLEVIGNAKVSGNLTLGLNTQITTIAGPANGGAIQIKSNSSLEGAANRFLRLGWNDNNNVFTPAMSINDNLNVGIGTTNPDQKLTVKGKIHTEEVIVDLLVPPDYVFQKYYTGKSALKSDYTMPTLAEVESFTKKNNHLPNVPSAKEIQEKGLQLGEMSNLLLQKIEELTIYVIEQNKKLNEQQKEIEQLKKAISN